tara:strand:- start:703 stop:900 length:198 start_codon:yes stop_codon:yes gene_type:complete
MLTLHKVGWSQVLQIKVDHRQLILLQLVVLLQHQAITKYIRLQVMELSLFRLLATLQEAELKFPT